MVQNSEENVQITIYCSYETKRLTSIVHEYMKLGELNPILGMECHSSPRPHSGTDLI